MCEYARESGYICVGAARLYVKLKWEGLRTTMERMIRPANLLTIPITIKCEIPSFPGEQAGNELIGRNIESLEILRDSGGGTYSVIKTLMKVSISQCGVCKRCTEYFKVDDKIKRISVTEYWSLKDEDKGWLKDEDKRQARDAKKI
jgi:hypothetical protein